MASSMRGGMPTSMPTVLKLSAQVREIDARAAEPEDVCMMIAGYWSWLVQLSETPKAFKTNDGAAKVRFPVAGASHTPASPKPMMSALPSPFTSARKRGYLSWLVQLSEAPKAFNTNDGAAKL